MNQIQFRRTLAKELLDYSYQVCEGEEEQLRACAPQSVAKKLHPNMPDNGQVASGQNSQQCSTSVEPLNCNKLCPVCIGIHIASKDSNNGIDN